jgi:2-polyprenyl-3-methyl-5-hydroxy-6-metoxy-1,4-benzoquinol methylase
LIAVENPPLPSELPGYYDEAYYSGGNELVYQNYLGTAGDRRESFRARLDDLNKFFKAPGSLIEIGAAYGLFLDVAREQGWQTQGVELSPISSAYAREHLGLNVITGDIKSVPGGQPYDLAVGWDVIEHLLDPMGTLARVSTLLRTRGLVALSTGNAACAGRWLYGSRWHLFAPPWHLYYFTKATLAKMLEKAGFQVVAVRHDGNPFYNRPLRTIREKILVKALCNRWTNGYVTYAASILRQGLAFTIYGRKVKDVEHGRS